MLADGTTTSGCRSSRYVHVTLEMLALKLTDDAAAHVAMLSRG